MHAKISSIIIAILFLATLLNASSADNTTYTPAADTAGKWTVTADPKLPNVLIIGDSISIGYTRLVRARLGGKANVYRPMLSENAPANCGDTKLALQNIKNWGLDGIKWSVIYFNWGLWDMCYRNPEAKTQGKRDKINGTLSVPIDEYELNLETLVSRLKQTGATLIWASTTVVPENEIGRFVGDDEKYNAVAAKVMEKNGVIIDDLFSLTQSFDGKYSTAKGDVHFTPEGYTHIAEQVSATIEKALPNQKSP